MGKIPHHLRETIARNIRNCRLRKFPGRGGAKKCAEEFGVSPQQWSPWERGGRTPDEDRLEAIAMFFGVTVEFLRRDRSIAGTPATPPPAAKPDAPGNNCPPQQHSNPIPHSLSVPEMIMSLHSMRLKAVYEVEICIKNVRYLPVEN